MENLSNQVLNMNKSKLEKLSKAKLIEILLKQQKPKKVSKPKRDLSTDLDLLIYRGLKSNRRARLIEKRYSNVLNMESNMIDIL